MLGLQKAIYAKDFLAFHTIYNWTLVYKYAIMLSMAKRNDKKLNSLDRDLPEGLLWTRHGSLRTVFRLPYAANM